MSVDPLAHFLRQLSPENRRWMEGQPEDKQRVIAERWEPAEGRGASWLASLDLAPDLVDEGASANAYLQEVRDGEEY
ncbi:hypothetical protein [Streptomyces sedi]|uniref:Uncharacterized protein n=1 Tax=Streptomyces sedi TaxID=555059 RepID=A0A5C4VEW1_9ACTN|nr:hypothetical protein [Streptomyces sedi]TNM34467.1 hypothetical protein FH715_02015 [Streptomyces sedi]